MDFEDFLLAENISTWLRHTKDPRAKGLQLQWEYLKGKRDKESVAERARIRETARKLKNSVAPESPKLELGVQRAVSKKAEAQKAFTDKVYEKAKKDIFKKLEVGRKERAAKRDTPEYKERTAKKFKNIDAETIKGAMKTYGATDKNVDKYVKKVKSSTSVPARPPSVAKFNPPESKKPESFKFTQSQPAAKPETNEKKTAKVYSGVYERDLKRLLAKLEGETDKKTISVIKKEIVALRKKIKALQGAGKDA